VNALTIANVETEIDNLAPKIAALLPPDVSPDKFRTVALAAIRAKPDLMHKCDQQSLFNAILNAAQDGLMPDGREGAIVPRKGKAVWQPMTLGILKRVKSSGSVATLAANVVYDGEPFEVLLGDEDRIVHRRDMAKVQRGHEVAVYAIATLKDGSKEREVMTWDQVQDVRQSSAVPDSEPWTKWADEMGRKTVIRRLAKRLPVLDAADEALQRTIGRVDSLYDFGTPAATIEHVAPDARDALNAEIPVTKQVPLTRAAATTTQRAPRVTEPDEQRPRKQTRREFLDALDIATRDAKSSQEADKLICSEEVLRAKEAFVGEAKERLDEIIARTLGTWFADEPADADASHEPEGVA